MSAGRRLDSNKVAWMSSRHWVLTGLYPAVAVAATVAAALLQLVMLGSLQPIRD